jgi:DNA-binding transcriptional MocR family regulator
MYDDYLKGDIMSVNSFDNYYMSWEPKKINDGKPIYISLADQLEKAIISGKLQPNAMLPPQRELADYLDLNLSTITRSIKRCELKGLLYSIIGKGTFVAPFAILNKKPIEVKKSIIKLSFIEPYPDYNNLISKTIQSMLNRQTINTYFSYQPSEIDELHLMAAKELFKSLNIDVELSNILICAGSQSALTIILLALCHSGDKIAVEEYTYHKFKLLASYMNIQLVPITCDNMGMLPERLEIICKRNNITAVYLMPTCNNPTSVRMPLKRRKELIEVVKKYNLIIIEDDPYRFFEDEKIATFYELIPQNTIYIFGTSKSLSTSLRIAYVASNYSFILKLNNSFECAYHRISPLDSSVISELILSGDYKILFKQKKKLSLERNQIVKKYFENINQNTNKYSYYLWLELLNNNSQDFFEKALKNNVEVMSSRLFSAGIANADSHIRIAISTPKTINELEKGLSLLKNIL